METYIILLIFGAIFLIPLFNLKRRVKKLERLVCLSIAEPKKEEQAEAVSVAQQVEKSHSSLVSESQEGPVWSDKLVA